MLDDGQPRTENSKATPKRARWWLRLLILGPLLLCCCLPLGVPVVHIEAHIYTLEHWPNHKGVLVACRQLMQKTPDARGHTVYGAVDQPPISNLPLAIQALAPSWVMVTKETVHIECGGGFYHYGLEALATDEGEMGGRATKLMDGLWLTRD